VITWEQIEARKKRLNELAMGLAKETVIVDEHDDPFLRAERLAYQKALRDALAGVEIARVTPAKATQRNARGGPSAWPGCGNAGGKHADAGHPPARPVRPLARPSVAGQREAGEASAWEDCSAGFHRGPGWPGPPPETDPR
jgi:hypothetical protein